MSAEKRIRKAPEVFIPEYIKTLKKERQPEKKRKVSFCEYRIISLPIKYSNLTDTLLIHGNIPLVQKDGAFFTDFSLLNEYHIYGNIQVTQFDTQKLVSIATERRTDVSFPRWKASVKKMIKDKMLNLRIWGKTIKSFCTSYEDLMTKFMERTQKALTIPDSQEQISLHLQENKLKKNNLIENHPCIQLKTHFRGFENRLVEVIVNERFLNTTGYTTETFVSTVLSEGLPRIIPLQVKSNSNPLKEVLELFALRKEYYFQTPEFETQIMTRSGYIKKTKAQVHFFINYEDGKFGSDTVFTFMDQELLHLLTMNSCGLSLNQEFIDAMLQREIETKDFLLNYYNYYFFPMYSNLHKVCTIKELIKDESAFI